MNDPQPTTALSQINAKLGQEAFRPLFEIATGPQVYLSAKVDYVNWGVEMIGFEADREMRNSVKTWNEAVAWAAEKDIKIISRLIPWQQVIYVQNLNYKVKG